jgi:hypothetical protein
MRSDPRRHPSPALPMERTMPKIRLGAVASLAALLALPSAAQAIVPAGNSAATQYTETFPTARGAEATKRRSKRDHRTPGEALGHKKLRKLAAEGPAGHEVAAIVAATAPTATAPNGSAPADRGPGAGPSGSGADGTQGRDGAPGGDGASGLREVIGHATGSSDSGEMGLLLPLLILAAIAGSAFYFLRQRRQAA